MANYYYSELLRLCGFEDSEINRESPRIERVFEKLELKPEDMSRAESWVKQNHDIELLGVRRILGLWLRELIDLVLAKDEGKKLIYYSFPTIIGPTWALADAAEGLVCTAPEVVLCYTLGQIFNKLNPILEAGEKNGLPPGHALCSLQQVRVGGMAKGIIPVPDLVLASSYFCDMGAKTDELLHHKYGHPAVYVDGSMDSRWGEFPEFLPERVDFLGGEVEKIFDAAKAVLGIKVTDEIRRDGASRIRKLSQVLGELVELTQRADPQPISMVTVELARRLTSGSASRRVITEGPRAIATLNEEVKERINKGIGVVEKGAPRAMIVLASFSDPSIVRMVENAGLALPVAVFAVYAAMVRKSTPFFSGEILAESEMTGGLYHSSYGLIKFAAEAARESKLDGVLWTTIFNCRPLAQQSHLVKQFMEKELGIPVLSLETDPYDSRSYSAAALRTRVETFTEMLRARKATAKN